MTDTPTPVGPDPDDLTPDEPLIDDHEEDETTEVVPPEDDDA